MKRATLSAFIVLTAVTLACTRRAEATRSYPPYFDAERQHAHPTTEQKLWALATCAVLVESHRGRHDLLGEQTSKTAKAEQEGLATWWGANNRSDLLATLDWIREGGHRREFDRMAKALSAATPTQIADLRNRLGNNPSLRNEVEVVLKYRNVFGAKSITGWDYARYVSLCRAGYVAGYLTEDEAWERIMPAARLLQRTFGSWDDLGENYLVGREFWSWEQTQRRGHLMRQSCRKLLTDPSSPWKKLRWDLDMTPADPSRDSSPSENGQAAK